MDQETATYAVKNQNSPDSSCRRLFPENFSEFEQQNSQIHQSQNIPNLIQNTELFKNKNLVGEPEFISGESITDETKFDHRSNLNRYRFAIDRMRIVDSASFRRLQYKTQVFVNHQGDHFRTRLTHTLEVAQIARQISCALQLNQDLSEVIALAHDLGHPPFGHAGEDALNKKMKNFGGFSHNAFGLKILTKIETKFLGFNGLNLNWEILEGLAKHNGAMSDSEFLSKNQQLDLDYVFEFNRIFDLKLTQNPSLEAQIAALADDIAYNNHDIEDGLRAGLIELEDLFLLPIIGEIYRRFFNNNSKTSRETLIACAKREATSLMIFDLILTTKKNLFKNHIQNLGDVASYPKFLVEFSPEIAEVIAQLKNFLMQKMYRHIQVNRMSVKGKKIISELFDFYFENPDCLPFDFSLAQTNIASSKSKQQLATLICDYIAGMTDRFAIKEHSQIQ